MITDSAKKGSCLVGMLLLLLGLRGPLEPPPTAPTLARFRSRDLSRNRSLLLMYINPLLLRPVFLPQLSCERLFLRVLGSLRGDAVLRSTLRFPMLSATDASEPLLDGRDAFRALLLLFLSNVLRPELPLGLFGDFGAVSGENPEGGFAVLMTGGLAGSSSRGTSSSCKSLSDGCEKAP